jgi:beta-lactamase regulating signal transducer with metallopeptidase domain
MSGKGSLAIGLVLLVRRILGARVAARWHCLLWLLVLGRLLVPAFVAAAQPGQPGKHPGRGCALR